MSMCVLQSFFQQDFCCGSHIGWEGGQHSVEQQVVREGQHVKVLEVGQHFSVDRHVFEGEHIVEVFSGFIIGVVVRNRVRVIISGIVFLFISIIIFSFLKIKNY